MTKKPTSKAPVVPLPDEPVVSEPLTMSVEQSHAAWSEAMRRDGWVYGPVEDWTRKTHPKLVPFADLPTDPSPE